MPLGQPSKLITARLQPAPQVYLLPTKLGVIRGSLFIERRPGSRIEPSHRCFRSSGDRTMWADPLPAAYPIYAAGMLPPVPWTTWSATGPFVTGRFPPLSVIVGL